MLILTKREYDQKKRPAQYLPLNVLANDLEIAQKSGPSVRMTDLTPNFD
jgi:hypothetical protein